MKKNTTTKKISKGASFLPYSLIPSFLPSLLEPSSFIHSRHHSFLPANSHSEPGETSGITGGCQLHGERQALRWEGRGTAEGPAWKPQCRKQVGKGEQEGVWRCWDPASPGPSEPTPHQAPGVCRGRQEGRVQPLVGMEVF